MKSIIMVLCAILLVSVNSHAADTRGVHYDSNEVLRVQSVLIGTVEDMRMVEIDERSTWSQTAGVGIGATLGGLAGGQFGKGKGKTAMTVVMAAMGGGIGNEVEQIMNTVKGIEFIVMLNDGRTVAVTQAFDSDSSSIQPGDRVRIVEGRNTRVVKLRNNTSLSQQQQQQQQLQVQLQLQLQQLQLEQQQIKLQLQQRGGTH